MAEILTEQLAFGRYKYGTGTEGTQTRKLIWISDYGPELVINGEGTNFTGWTQSGDGVFSINASRFRYTAGISGANGSLIQNIAVESGASYNFRASNHGGTSSYFQTLLGNAPGYGQYYTSGNNVVVANVIIVPTQASIAVTLIGGYPTAGLYAEWSLISLRKIT